MSLLIAGVDEAGRGPLAGPVFAAAVILNPATLIEGLADSKKLTEKKREQLFATIQEKSLSWSIASASVAEIDQLNILQATLVAMQRAVNALSIKPQHVQVDGTFCPKLDCTTEAIIRGDTLIPAISAASILAKVARDRLLIEYDQQYPQYGFAKHKGYGTTEHLLALKQFGVSPIHRKTFAPIKSYYER
jgi:ribonuclease HII